MSVRKQMSKRSSLPSSSSSSRRELPPRDRRPVQHFVNTMSGDDDDSQSRSSEESSGITLNSSEERTHTSEYSEELVVDDAYDTDGVVNESDSSVQEELARAHARNRREESEEIYPDEDYSDSFSISPPRPRHHSSSNHQRGHRSIHRQQHSSGSKMAISPKLTKQSPRVDSKHDRHSYSRSPAISPSFSRSRSLDRSPPPHRQQYYYEDEDPRMMNRRHSRHHYDDEQSSLPPRHYEGRYLYHDLYSHGYPPNQKKRTNISAEAKQFAKYIVDYEFEVDTGERKMKKVIQAMIDTDGKVFQRLAAELKVLKSEPITAIAEPTKKTLFGHLYTWSPAAENPEASLLVERVAKDGTFEFFKIPDEWTNLRKVTAMFDKHATPEDQEIMKKRKDKEVGRVDWLQQNGHIELEKVGSTDLCSQVVFQDKKMNKLVSVIQAAAIRANKFIAITPTTDTPPIPVKLASKLILASNRIVNLIEHFCVALDRQDAKKKKNKNKNKKPEEKKKRRRVVKKKSPPPTPSITPKKKKEDDEEEEEEKKEIIVEEESATPKVNKKKSRATKEKEEESDKVDNDEEEEEHTPKKLKKNDGEPEKKKRSPVAAKKSPKKTTGEEEGDEIVQDEPAATAVIEPKKKLSLADLGKIPRIATTTNADNIKEKLAKASLYDDDEDDDLLIQYARNRTLQAANNK